VCVRTCVCVFVCALGSVSRCILYTLTKEPPPQWWGTYNGGDIVGVVSRCIFDTSKIKRGGVRKVHSDGGIVGGVWRRIRECRNPAPKKRGGGERLAVFVLVL